MKQIYDIKNDVNAMRSKIKKIEKFDDIIGRQLSELSLMVNNFERDADFLASTDRNLRIAVIGQVKAGKSTMLNALLFDGECLLPSAATPMTAALTVIKYSPQMKVEIEYYDKNDWNNIVSISKNYEKLIGETRQKLIKERNEQSAPLFGTPAFASQTSEISLQEILLNINMPEEFKVCNELVTMAASIRDIDSYLGRTEEITGINEHKELLEKLHNYVGTKGKLTPLVKSATIYYNDRRLEGFEIIDTPGINDPIISRGQKTKNYLGSCDVIIMLSSSKQFVDSVDMQLLAQNLPEKGIKEIILVGSMFDLTIYGEHQKYPNINALLSSMELKLEEYVQKSFSDLEKKCKTAFEKEILQRLKNVVPIFISSMAYIAAKHNNEMNADERHIVNLLNKMYKEQSFGINELIELSNIPALKSEVEKQMNKKSETINSRFSERANSARSAFNNFLLTIEEDVKKYLLKLDSEDMASLQSKEKEITERLSHGKNKIENTFDNLNIKIRQDLSMLVTEIKSISLQFEKIKEKSESKTESYEEKIPRKVLGFDVSWAFGYRTETHTRTINYHYADVHESISLVKEFIYEAEKKIKQSIIDIVDIVSFREEVKKGAMSLFDMKDVNFDFEDISIPVERAVKKIAIPEIEFGDKDYSATIVSRFNKGRVYDNEIQMLRSAQSEAIYQVLEEIDSAVKIKIKEIIQMLETSKSEFLDSLLKEINEELNLIKTQLKNKQASKDNLNSLAGVIKEIKYM
ncbi:MAG: dynamin family protein [Candidatus Wallbacteria bacterium]